MGKLKSLEELFEGRHFDREVIILCVRWYLRFKLSLRDLVEMMAERGLSMAHTTIMRWVRRYAPEFEKRWRRFAQAVGRSWRVDETYVKIRGEWALVQTARSDRLCWRLNWLRVGNGQAEERGGAVRGSPLRPRSYHLVRALVSSIQAEPARPGGDDGRARPVDGAYDDYALGAALRTGVRETLETVCPGSRSVMASRRDIRQDPRRVVLPL